MQLYVFQRYLTCNGLNGWNSNEGTNKNIENTNSENCKPDSKTDDIKSGEWREGEVKNWQNMPIILLCS